MIERGFDILIASLALLLISPIIATVALALRIEGRGPVLHWSPRLGRGGAFSTWFASAPWSTPRPASVQKSASPRSGASSATIRWTTCRARSMCSAATSAFSARAPWRCTLTPPADATWQRILSVRPGYASYAILKLASRYNASSAAEKQQLELDYVRRQSMLFGVCVLAATLQAFVASTKGNRFPHDHLAWGATCPHIGSIT